MELPRLRREGQQPSPCPLRLVHRRQPSPDTCAAPGKIRGDQGRSLHHPGGPVDASWARSVLAPALAGVRLGEIRAACGVAKSTASAWRAGARVPHSMHWEALAALVGLDYP
ncbi:MAG: hypothetical protein ACRDVP_03040 [Acidimicrobiales bacterium]